MSRRKKPDSPTYITQNGQRVECVRCGAALDMPLPMEIKHYTRQLSAFVEAHRWCVAKEEKHD